ncbi:MAG TPA: PqqD family protein [Gaiellaceae bacterium]|jgi:Coenzyme PQQ synthesis protein D (PqqD)
MSAKPDAAAKLRPDADVVAQRLGDEIVMVHLRTNQIFVLNRTGARFWELLADGSDLEDAKAKLLAEFDVAEERLEQELEEFIALLSKEKLIDVDESA